MNARTNTPDRIHSATSRTIAMKRACNGCGQLLGDVEDRDVDANGNLTDVRGECDNCRPVVELETTGCKTWQLTHRNIRGIDHELDRLDVFAKDYTQYVDDRLTVVGLRIGEKPGHVVARFGDWIIRHPDGGFTVHKAPAEVSA
jgi:hypothetical protein